MICIKAWKLVYRLSYREITFMSAYRGHYLAKLSAQAVTVIRSTDRSSNIMATFQRA